MTAEHAATQPSRQATCVPTPETETLIKAKRYFSSSVGFMKKRLALEGQIKQALCSLKRHLQSKDHEIPKSILINAQGIVFLTIVKAGFLFGVQTGTGICILRMKDGNWSAPSSLGIGGPTLGFQAGASKVDLIIILNSEAAVKSFLGQGQVQLGGNLNVSVGPVGRNFSGSVGGGDGGASALWSYSMSQGLFAGVGLEGMIILQRPACNKEFYSQIEQWLRERSRTKSQSSPSQNSQANPGEHSSVRGRGISVDEEKVQSEEKVPENSYEPLEILSGTKYAMFAQAKAESFRELIAVLDEYTQDFDAKARTSCLELNSRTTASPSVEFILHDRPREEDNVFAVPDMSS